MKYDVLVIGGGLAGLTAALRLAQAGRRVAVFSAGMSALHFSSGSIDLWGRNPDGRVEYEPFNALAGLPGLRPDHPYNRCGLETIRAALSFFRDECAREGLKLWANGSRNHFHVTALGTLKPTYFSPDTVYNDRIHQAFEQGPWVAILTFEGYRDFHPELAAASLRRHPLFQKSPVTTGRIRLPLKDETGRPVHELRSIDVGRLFDRDQAVEETAAAIRRAAPEADMVGLPAFIGLAGYARVLPRLMELTGKIIYEVPTLPPSILGLRMDQALKNRLAGQGGLLIPGDRVVGGEIRNGRLASVETQMYGPVRLAADHFILATGSFFSGGLVSRPDRMVEPVFGLEIRSEPLRTHWVGRRFFDPGSHPFLSYGVETDERLRPRMPDGRPLDNLYAAGAVLAGYDPIAEASGGGVAVATGYRAALLVLEEDGDRP